MTNRLRIGAETDLEFMSSGVAEFSAIGLGAIKPINSSFSLPEFYGGFQ